MEMEKKVFKTLVKDDHKFSNSPYVRGRIFGIAEIICDLIGGVEDGERHLRGGFWTNDDESVRYLRTYCTEEQYEQFKNYVEDKYPGLCEFYWND